MGLLWGRPPKLTFLSLLSYFLFLRGFGAFARSAASQFQEQSRGSRPPEILQTSPEVSWKFPRLPRGQPLCLGSLTPGKRKTYTGTNPSPFSKKAMQWGKKMAGTNEFAFFHCRSMCTGGVQNQAEKNSGNAVRPVPVPGYPPMTHNSSSESLSAWPAGRQ